MAEAVTQPARRVGAVAWGVPLEQVAAFGLSALAVGGLAASQGGYFEPAWGWSALGFFWVASVALAVRSSQRVGRLELVAVAALTGLLVWTAASALWSVSLSNSIDESLRLLVYVGCILAVLSVASKRAVPALLAGVLAGITAICCYATGTRLFPDTVHYDPIAVYRLSAPVGYWNALGLLAAIGLILGIGLSARATTPLAGALFAAPLPALGVTLLFTFGRGAWVALAAGLAAIILSSSSRAELVASLAVLSIAPGAAILIASRFDGLTHQSAPLPQIESDGRRLALALAGLVVVSALVGAARSLLAARVPLDPRQRRARSVAVALVAGALVVGAVVAEGGPVAITDRATGSFNTPPPRIGAGGSYTQRLFTLSNNGRSELWSVAWEGFREHPLDGLGAGGYEFLWNQRRPTQLKVRDAHGLYQETLAELGVVGFALLVTVLAAPLAAAIRVRRSALAPVALGAYVAFLVHAFADWDWEVPAVTVAGLVCGAALLLLVRDTRAFVPGGSVRLAGSVVVAALGIVALIGWIGSTAISQSTAAAERGDSRASLAEADKAIRWAPWSAEARRLQAEARVRRGDLSGAAKSFRAAIDRSPEDWRLWLGLAVVTRGPERAHAAAMARRLNPRGYIARVLIPSRRQRD